MRYLAEPSTGESHRAFWAGGGSSGFADGSVRTVPRTINMQRFENLATMGGGEGTSGF
jgi:hypothetical protein